MSQQDPVSLRVVDTEEAGPGRARVLVVEDQPAIARTVAQALTRVGHQCQVADSVHQAKLSLTNDSFDIVITDVHLPDGSGLELVRLVKDHTPDVQVLVMTAYADVKIAIDALRLEADDYLLKPFDLGDLTHGVQRA